MAQCVYDSSEAYICQCKQGFIGNGYNCKGIQIFQIKYKEVLNIFNFYLNYNNLYNYIYSVYKINLINIYIKFMYQKNNVYFFCSQVI